MIKCQTKQQVHDAITERAGAREQWVGGCRCCFHGANKLHTERREHEGGSLGRQRERKKKKQAGMKRRVEWMEGKGDMLWRVGS